MMAGQVSRPLEPAGLRYSEADGLRITGMQHDLAGGKKQLYPRVIHHHDAALPLRGSSHVWLMGSHLKSEDATAPLRRQRPRNHCWSP